MPRRKKEISNKKTGQNFEDFVRKTINSGTLKIDPLDLSNSKYCIECKTVKEKTKSYRISLKEIEKSWNRSLDLGKSPVWVIGIPKNEHEQFVLTCQVTLKKRRGN